MNEDIQFILSFENRKDPGFSTEAVGRALGTECSDKRFRITPERLMQVDPRVIRKVTEYIRIASKANFLEDEL